MNSRNCRQSSDWNIFEYLPRCWNVNEINFREVIRAPRCNRNANIFTLFSSFFRRVCINVHDYSGWTVAIDFRIRAQIWSFETVNCENYTTFSRLIAVKLITQSVWNFLINYIAVLINRMIDLFLPVFLISFLHFSFGAADYASATTTVDVWLMSIRTTYTDFLLEEWTVSL